MKRTYHAILLLFFSFFCMSGAVAQDFTTLKWSDKIEYTILLDSVERPFFFEGASFDDESPLPYYTYTYALGEDYAAYDYDVRVEYPDFRPLPLWQKRRIEELGVDMPVKIDVKKDIRMASGKAYLVVSFVPMSYRDGEYCRMESFRLNIKAVKKAANRIASTKSDSSDRYAANSVLAEGKWYKIGIQNSGVYAISNSKLASLGFSDPSKVAIYGYGGNLLQEDFSKFYCDDLPEVPVVRTSNAILFYAEGVLRSDVSSSSTLGSYWNPTTNYCSDTGYYFITEKDNPASFEEAEDLPATSNVVTQFDEYIYYKGDEKYTWADFGRRMYDSYDYRNGREKKYTFTLNGLVAETLVRFNVAFATERTSTQNYLIISANGEQIGKSSSMSTGSSSNYVKSIRSVTSAVWEDNTSSNLTLTLNHSISGNSSGHLEYILINYKRELNMTSSSLVFANISAKGNETYKITNVNASTVVWDVTYPGQYRQMKLNINGSEATFTDNKTGMRKYVAVKTNASQSESYTTPVSVSNQNLHALRDVDMVVLIPKNGALYGEAERLADEHRNREGLNVVTVNAGDVYNEFSSGTPDVTAYRRFLKMLYDKGSNDGRNLKYLLLFGDCAYDNRMRTSVWSGFTPDEMLLCYLPFESEDEQNTFMSDDYIGYLDDNEGTSISSARNTVDIGIGRLPVRNVSEASLVVDKLIKYMNNDDKGAWKNTVCLVADDNLDDGGTIHMEQADEIATYVDNLKYGYLTERLFLDMYKREASSTGYSYPLANQRLQTLFNEGMLVLTYVGHSNTDYWTSKRVLTSNDVVKLKSDRLPLWVTASCDYTRLDAFSRSSGELAMLNGDGGAVGLFSTTRVVYVSSNHELNKIYQKHLFSRKEDGSHYTLGEIYMKAKQERSLGSASKNDLNFVFIGDPAMTLTYPDNNKLVIDSINGVEAGSEMTQFKAGETINIKGHVVSGKGETLTDFNGNLDITVMDSKELLTTLNNADHYDSNGVPDTIKFLSRTNRLALSKGKVEEGKFVVTFPVPLDINYSNQSGLISMYAQDSLREANLGYEDFIVGGAVEDLVIDGVGPKIWAYLNTPDFVYGDKVNESPVLYVNLCDSDGLNISGSGLGHNIVAVIDNDPNLTYTLNDYYVSSDYMNGTVTYKISGLSEGKHTMMIRAWDVFNNSSTAEIGFEVVEGLQPNLYDVTCISPATNQTTFFITHNRPNSNVDITLEVFSFSGSALFKTQVEDVTSSNVYTYTWDLCGNGGAPLDSGVYLYRVTFSADDGESVSQTKKIVIIRQ